MNLSFSGCGFMAIYHLGVASCFKTLAPHILQNKISGSSAGSCLALALALDTPLGDITADMMAGIHLAKLGILGPFSPSFNPEQWIRDNLTRRLPKDAFKTVTGKLHVSLTTLYDGQKIIVNKFSSNQELIEVIIASCFIPCFSGLVPPKYKGLRVIDGGYIDNLPVLDPSTVTVSPFSGDADICPSHDLGSSMMVNFGNTNLDVSRENTIRMVNILLPPPPELLSSYCRQGFDDALRFLQSRYLKMAVASCYLLESPDTTNVQEYKIQRESEIRASFLPQSVTEVFDIYVENEEPSCDKVIKQNKLMKVLIYPSLYFMHFMMVIKPEWVDDCVHYFIMWLFTFFLPKLSWMAGQFFARITDFFHEPYFSKYIHKFDITEYYEVMKNILRLDIETPTFPWKAEKHSVNSKIF